MTLSVIQSHRNGKPKRKSLRKKLVSQLLLSITQSYRMKRGTKTKTISLLPSVLAKGLKAAKKRGFGNSFSAYVAKRIEEDDAQIAAATNGAPKKEAVPA